MIEPTSYQLAILNGLQHKRAGEVYQGTVTRKVKVGRRAANRVARVSRRINRAGAR